MDDTFRTADVSGVHAGDRLVQREPERGRQRGRWRKCRNDGSIEYLVESRIESRCLHEWIGVMLLLLCAWIAGIWPGDVHAQSGSAVVSVEVDTPAIAVRNVRGLDFGTFLGYGRTGTIVLGADGSVQANNVHLLDPAAVHASSWEITGTPGAPYAVSMPPITNVFANGMSMSISPLVRSGPVSLVLDMDGKGRIDIGGTLNIPPYIVPGIYEGVFAITVHYN